MIFIDSNVVIDVLETGSRWSEWSRRKLGLGHARGLAINHVVLAEVAPSFENLLSELMFFDAVDVAIAPLTDKAAYRAGKAHAAYRAAGGGREAILADFLIAGHASILGATLLTRDRARFATYFPELALLTPEDDDDG